MAKAKDAATAAQDATPANNDAGAQAAQTPVNAATETTPAVATESASPAGLRALIEALPDDHPAKAAMLAAHDSETEAAQAAQEEAVAAASDPSTIVMRAPADVSGIAIDGKEYQVNKHGLIEIAIEDVRHVAIALEHGFQRAVAAVRKLL